MSPTTEPIHDSTATFGACQRFLHSGRPQAGIQYLMGRWRAIPAALHTRFLHDDFLTLPAETRAGLTDRLLVRSREAGHVLASEVRPSRGYPALHRSESQPPRQAIHA
jgi:hypothetical protein